MTSPYKIIWILFLFLSLDVSAQKKGQQRIDSLIAELPKNKDSAKVIMLCEISSSYSNINPIEGVKYGEQGLHIAKNTKWETATAEMNRCIGINFLMQSEFPQSLKYLLESRQLFEKIKNNKGLARCLTNIGNVYISQSNYPLALEYYFKSLRVHEEIGDQVSIASSLGNIGIVYTRQKNYAISLEYYFKALEIAEKMGNKNLIAKNLSSLALVFYNQKDYLKALEYHQKALSVSTELGNKNDIAKNLGNIGNIYTLQGKYSEGLENLLSALKINEEIGSKDGTAVDLGNIGINYLSHFKNNMAPDLNGHPSLSGKVMLSNALLYFDKAIEIDKKIGNLDRLQGFLNNRAEAEALMGNYIAAYSSYKEHVFLRDSIFNKEKNNEITRLELKYEYSKREDSFNFQQRLTDQQLKEQTLLVLQHSQQLALSNKEKDLQKLAYLKSEADLENEQNRTVVSEKALMIVRKENDLQSTSMNLQRTQLELKDRELQTKKLQRNVFIGGIFAILIFSGFSFYRYRKLQQLEHHHAVLNERLRISRDLHDDMGATLSGISVYSIAAKQRLNDSRFAEANLMLDTISEDARDMVGNMSDMVWMINPQNDHMEKLLDRMRLFASNVLSARNIFVQFKAEENLNSLSLSMDARKNIFLIFKEAINNIAKYAEATTVTIGLEQHVRSLEMSISDNGKGFNADDEFPGNGLRNMKQRAQELKGKISFVSAIGDGTTVLFNCYPHN